MNGSMQNDSKIYMKAIGNIANILMWEEKNTLARYLMLMHEDHDGTDWTPARAEYHDRFVIVVDFLNEIGILDAKEVQDLRELAHNVFDGLDLAVSNN